jgi:hypothetical protein
MPIALNLAAQRFGRLVALSVTTKKNTTGKSKRYWACQCDCGAVTEVETYSLRCGETTSCGCFHVDQLVSRSTKHGASGTPTYHSWSSMIWRCASTKPKYFKYYGARGITVCERWQIFENFLADMGERPAGTTIDRINNDGNYEPGNCRWASWSVQLKNRRRYARS